MKIIAHIRTDFPTKFGVPRQASLADALEGTIVFTPEFRNPDCLRGIEGWSHLWLLWRFHRTEREDWSPTVLPPKLGSKTRVGVFATRSPFRPNPIGLSSVRLLSVSWHSPEGPLLHVAGVDLIDGTPIYDLKPYVPYSDSHPDAKDAFSGLRQQTLLQVDFPPELLCQIPPQKRQGLLQALALDTRPGYQHDPARRYGFNFSGFDVRFTVDGQTLHVVELVRL